MPKEDSDKTSKTQITVAVIGLIGLVTVALIANVDKLWPKPNDNRTANANALNTNIAVASPTSPSSESSRATRFPDSCLNQNLSVVPGDRRETVAIEGGEPDIIKGKQSKDGLAAVWLIASNRPVGAITFSPTYVDSENYSFRVEHLLNSKCQETDYVNIDNPEYRPVLHNWNRIRMTLDSQEYWLRLGYNTRTHAITARFLDKEIQ